MTEDSSGDEYDDDDEEEDDEEEDDEDEDEEEDGRFGGGGAPAVAAHARTGKSLSSRDILRFRPLARLEVVTDGASSFAVL